MSVAATHSNVVLTHPNGSTAEILLHGATVISWCAPSPSSPASGPTQRLYTSRTAHLDGSKPVRGGIPLVFPFFGPPTRPEHAALPQHGFARSTRWTYTPSPTPDAPDAPTVSARFLLPARDAYPALTYTVTLAAHHLTSSLHLTAPPSPSPTPLLFQALFHTYLRAHAPHAHVAPLQGLFFRDKLQPGAPTLRETRSDVDVRRPVDAVYQAAGRAYTVNTGHGILRVAAAGLDDLVIWNPGPAAGRAIPDLEDGGWDMFICVEPGTASYWVELQPGESWTGEQVLTVV